MSGNSKNWGKTDQGCRGEPGSNLITLSHGKGKPRGTKSTGRNTEDQQYPHPIWFWGTLELFAFIPETKPALGTSPKHPAALPCSVSLVQLRSVCAYSSGRGLGSAGLLTAPPSQPHSPQRHVCHQPTLQGSLRGAGDVTPVRHCPNHGSHGCKKQKYLKLPPPIEGFTDGLPGKLKELLSRWTWGDAITRNMGNNTCLLQQVI